MSRKPRNLAEVSERGRLMPKQTADRLEEVAYEDAAREMPLEPGMDLAEWGERVKARAAELVAERSSGPGEWWAER